MHLLKLSKALALMDSYHGVDWLEEQHTDKEPIAPDAVRPSPAETSSAPRGAPRHSARPGRAGAGAGHATRARSRSLSPFRCVRSSAFAALGGSPGGTERTGGARSGAASRPRRDIRGNPGRCGGAGCSPHSSSLVSLPGLAPALTCGAGTLPPGGGPAGTGTGTGTNAACSRRPPQAAPRGQGRRGPGPSTRLRPPAGSRAPVPTSGPRPAALARGRGRRKMAAGRAGGPAPLRHSPGRHRPRPRLPAPPLSPPSRTASSSSSPGRGAAAAALAEPGSCAFSP